MKDFLKNVSIIALLLAEVWFGRFLILAMFLEALGITLVAFGIVLSIIRVFTFV